MPPYANPLEEAYKTMIQIVATRQDGRAYIPIILRLEKEIEAQRGEDAEYDRIRRMAALSAA